jgi:hypothetical protein
VLSKPATLLFLSGWVLLFFAFLTDDAALCCMHCRVCGQLTEWLSLALVEFLSLP